MESYVRRLGTGGGHIVCNGAQRTNVFCCERRVLVQRSFDPAGRASMRNPHETIGAGNNTCPANRHETTRKNMTTDCTACTRKTMYARIINKENVSQNAKQGLHNEPH